jgi:hypothetical protein
MTNRELIINNIKKLVSIAKYNGDETLVTLNKEFIPDTFHDEIDKIINKDKIEKFEFFDIINQKIDSSDIKNTDWGFLRTDLINCKSSVDIYYLSDKKLINNYNKTVIGDFLNRYIIFKNLCEENNIEIKDEEAFKQITLKSNYNQNLLLLSALFNIHPDFIKDNNLHLEDSIRMKECKEIWKKLILNKKEECINTLEIEKNEAELEKDENTLSEIKIILDLLNNIDKESNIIIDENIETIKDLICHWPSLLLPPPNMVNYE